MPIADDCACLNEECRTEQFETETVDALRLGSSFARLERCICRDCARAWLRYVVEEESNAGWGKWYRAIVPPGAPDDLDMETAAQAMARIDWHFYGGPWYRSAGERALGPMPIALPAPLAAAA